MRIGTRKSTMALAQTEDVARQIRAARPGTEVEVVKFSPIGDRDQVAKLGVHGGKGGAFVSQIRDAMLAGELEAAMHSLKDMPGNEETPGLVIGAYTKREAVSDVLAVRPGVTFEAIKAARGKGFKIGTNAVRRAAYLRRLLPDAEIIHFRGAADKRIEKLDAGAMQALPGGGSVGPADALVLAKAGMVRVGLESRIAHEFSVSDMLPAVGQGIVAVECPARAWATRDLLTAIDDEASRLTGEAEREVLWLLDGHCNSPMAGLARIEGREMRLTASVISEDGARIIEATRTGPAVLPRELGRQVAFDLLDKGAREIIEATRPELTAAPPRVAG